VGVPSVVTKGTLSGDMVTEAGCGIAIDWSLASFRELVELLGDADLVRKMGDNGRRVAEERYNWEEMRSRLVEAYSLLQL
jgi:glycosyltransferase involved in cell wall biosynthesis